MNIEVHIPTYPCFICGTHFKMGHGAWHGRYIKAWKLTVCDGCYTGNYDGIVPRASLLAKLEATGVVPTYNADGYIAWPRNG